ncbi:dihydroorotase [Aneurinibacillus thermoaerophilus]|uniref:Dihydroorotase n=1 Tax=Aneurinibacillus thermoaerophilus TaxID=143495 RepID=A0A1G7WA32_ANETH|nr:MULTISPECIES: dihydroorotase [Aneurinibacillus]AMA72593.1 dihydroorotase [Aneurinibacillus sp. XH2]MED0756712.1 dihydroorotase [Aneurinibacillus thermoaerophilus]MED0760762.1 dihydroorotase [Aneurinibacillus thermoaerophilus]QYY41657.1 dihydroorotase [Aneurinibacillus thermoaerophilus]SDG68709.1 dihydroorotase [Aneurinibacillus thermoaerophilus]
MGTILCNGQILVDGKLVKKDILIEGTNVSRIADSIEEAGHEVLDAAGKLIVPGFIDMHVHLREPGFEAKETIATGTASAARGGFTTVACMPNTRPVIDTPETVRLILQKAKEEGSARVLPMGAITVRELGQELTDMAALKEAGVIAVSDDGVGVQSSKMMKDAMKVATSLGLPVVAHCEDDSLVEGGCVHEGVFSEKHGLKGIPSEAESIHVGRDILLAEATGAHYHVCHISTAESVRLVREAKQRGVRVTAEVCPHHLLLCDEDIPGPDANYKMNPPLRSRRDRQALLQGLKDGTIDMIVTDHAPHTAEEKGRGIELAPFGIVGLETAFPLLYTKLVLTGEFTLQEIVDRMTRVPAEVFNLPWGALEEGKSADIAVIDLETEKEVNPETFASKGRNTPFTGWKLKGWPVLTMLEGRIVWQAEEMNSEGARQ